MRFHAAAVLLFAVMLLGCAMPVDGYLRIPDPDPATNSKPPVFAGWKCPASKDMSHFVAVVNPACMWVPGGLFVESCKRKYQEHNLEAFGCTRDPTVKAWYLMMPPLDPYRRMNPDAPLQDWDIFHRYKTETECQKALSELKPSTDVAQRREDLIQPLHDSRQDEIAAGTPYAKCALSDVARPNGDLQ